MAVSPVQHHCAVDQRLRVGTADVVSDWQALPFANESVDVVVLLHALEQTHHPMQVLAEISRVLRPNGHVLLIGFNTWRRHARLFGHALYQTQWVGGHGFPTGLRSQLTHVGLEVNKCHRYGFWMSKGVSSNSKIERLGRTFFPGLSVGYLWVIQKNVFCLTPIKAAWIPAVTLPLKAPQPVAMHNS